MVSAVQQIETVMDLNTTIVESKYNIQGCVSFLSVVLSVKVITITGLVLIKYLKGGSI